MTTEHLRCKKSRSATTRTLALPDVAARAGHANPAVTARIYAHALEDSHQRAADAVAVMLAND